MLGVWKIEIERETVDQAKGSAFFRHKAGRVGASKCRAASHTDLHSPPSLWSKLFVIQIFFAFPLQPQDMDVNVRILPLQIMKK